MPSPPGAAVLSLQSLGLQGWAVPMHGACSCPLPPFPSPSCNTHLEHPSTASQVCPGSAGTPQCPPRAVQPKLHLRSLSAFPVEKGGQRTEQSEEGTVSLAAAWWHRQSYKASVHLSWLLMETPPIHLPRIAALWEERDGHWAQPQSDQHESVQIIQHNSARNPAAPGSTHLPPRQPTQAVLPELQRPGVRTAHSDIC